MNTGCPDGSGGRACRDLGASGEREHCGQSMVTMGRGHPDSMREGRSRDVSILQRRVSGSRWGAQVRGRAGCVLKAVTRYGWRSSSAQVRQVRVLDGLVARQVIGSKFIVCSLCTKHLIFDLHALHVTSRRNSIWALVIQSKRSFSLIGQEKF